MDPHDPASDAGAGVGALLARAAAADARAERRLATAADDLLQRDGRLDDQVRALVWSALDRLIGAIETDIRHQIERQHGAAAVGSQDNGSVACAVVDAGVLDDRALLDELVARAWGEAIAGALPGIVADTDSRPSLLTRLAAGSDRVTAAAATIVLSASARRRDGDENAGRGDLPAELQHRLTWWVAAALRGNQAGRDAALVDAAKRVLAAHDEGIRLEAAASRLAAALDPAPEEVGELLEEALSDRQLAVFVALLAHALAIDPGSVRAMVLDPDGSRLWLALRALDLSRPTTARIALALADADRRRNAHGVADAIDTVMAITPDHARAALASLKLPAEYRAALRALERGR